MNARRAGWPALLAAALLLAALQLQLRPLMPVDETRYLSVAWEMWARGDFLVPWLNGEPYHHKPPVLFWLTHLVWSVGGVSDQWVRWLPVLFSLLMLWLTAKLGERLWDAHAYPLHTLAPWLLAGTLFWSHFFTWFQFDGLLGVAVLLAWHGVLTALYRPFSGWALTGIATGLGVLIKGPVVLVAVLPAVLSAPWWAGDGPRRWWRWALGAMAALAVAVTIALAWALPASDSAGAAFREAILWGQSTGRIVDAFAHREPWYSYLWWLPVMFLPWTLWPRLWRAVANLSSAERGVRFCVAVLVPALLVFSLISGKQPKYLLPLLPLVALLMARAATAVDSQQTPRRPWFAAVFVWLGGLILLLAPMLLEEPLWVARVSPWWGVALCVLGALLAMLRLATVNTVRGAALASLLTAGCFYLALFPPARHAYDLQPVAQRVADVQNAGRPVAWLGRYHGELHFPGRLRTPLAVLESPDALRAWLAEHPAGILVVKNNEFANPESGALLVSPYRGGSLVVWPAAELRGDPRRFDSLEPAGR